jgi:hypothetical protein
MTTLSNTQNYQKVYSYFKPINKISRAFPLISQSWGMFSPNPSHEIGFITVEGIRKGGSLTNLSELNPFKNHYKTTNNNVVNKVMLTMRFMYSNNHHKSKNLKTKEIIKIWEDFECKRIMKNYKINEFSEINIVFYSCSVEEYSKNNKYNFKKIIIKNLF